MGEINTGEVAVQKKKQCTNVSKSLVIVLVTYLISLKVILFVSFQMLKATVIHHACLYFIAME